MRVNRPPYVCNNIPFAALEHTQSKSGPSIFQYLHHEHGTSWQRRDIVRWRCAVCISGYMYAVCVPCLELSTYVMPACLDQLAAWTAYLGLLMRFHRPRPRHPSAFTARWNEISRAPMRNRPASDG